MVHATAVIHVYLQLLINQCRQLNSTLASVHEILSLTMLARIFANRFYERISFGFPKLECWKTHRRLTCNAVQFMKPTGKFSDGPDNVMCSYVAELTRDRFESFIQFVRGQCGNFVIRQSQGIAGL